MIVDCVEPVGYDLFTFIPVFPLMCFIKIRIKRAPFSGGREAPPKIEHRTPPTTTENHNSPS